MDYREIYVYTTESDRKIGQYKFGQTKIDSISRVKQQQTGNSERLEVIYSCASELSDYFIHNELEKLGYYRVGKGGSEWFGGFKSDDEAVAAFLKILHDGKSISKIKYIPRFYQTYFKNEFLSKLDKDERLKKEYALEFGPRFRKTSWSLDLMPDFYDCNYKICLLPSYVLTSHSSFEKDFYKFEGFSDKMVFVSKKDNFKEIIDKYYGKKLIILPISLHEEKYEEKYEIIKNLPVSEKVMIIDEADFGSHTEKSQKLIDYLNSGLSLYLTGTAINKVTYKLKNLNDNIIRFSYTEMLMIKKGEHPIQKDLIDKTESMDSVEDIVEPRFFRLSLGGVIDKFNSVPGEYKTDWNKLLMDVDKSSGILSQLIKSLFGVYNGNMTFLMDINTSEFSPKDVTMIFASTPDKKQQHKLAKLIQNTLGGQYFVELINSDTTSNREVEDKIKKSVARAKKESKKIVLLSDNMASRSFSIPEIDTVILMFDRGQYSTISQKIARVLTSGNTYHGDKKTHGNIISLSLDPNREDSSPIDEYLVYESEKVKVDELSDAVKRVLRSVNIFTNNQDELQPIEFDSYVDRLISSTSLIRLGVEGIEVNKVIGDTELVKILSGIDIIRNLDVEEKLEGIDSSEVIRTRQDNEKEKKEVKKKVDNLEIKLREILSNIVESASEFSEINNCESDDIFETIRMIREKGYDDEVIFEAGVDTKTIEKILNSGAISVRLLNTIITSYNNEEKLAVCIVKLKNWKQNPSKGEVFTPVALVNEILNNIPEHVWRNPNSTFLDPCMGRGTFLIEIVNRLVYIYGYTEKDAKSRVFGFDIRLKYVSRLVRRGFVNVRHKDFLREVINMKFDVVIGNPPYQENMDNGKSKGGGKGGDKNLYSKFIKKSFDILGYGGSLFFLVPPSVFSPKNSNRDILLSDNNNLKLVKFFDKNPFPNVNTNVCYFNLVKGENKGDTLVLYKNTEILTRLGKDQIFPSNFDKTSLSIFSKIFNQDLENMGFIRDCSLHTQKKELFSKTITDSHMHPIYSGSKLIYCSQLPNNITIRKIVVSRSGYFKPILDNGFAGTSESNFFITGDNIDKKYQLLTHPLYRFIVEKSKFNGYINQDVLNRLPFYFTEETPYKFFGLTEDEITYVESNVR